MAVMSPALVSKKVILPKERLIVALDVDGADEARALVERLSDSVLFYKLGLQLFMGNGYFDLVETLRSLGKKVFVDLKFFDVPETVGSAVRALAKRDVAFATVHGNAAILKSACAARGQLKILAVTVLTNLDQKDIEDLGFPCNLEELTLSRARNALALGCDGVISSGLEVPRLRAELGEPLIVVSPGIRPVDSAVAGDDQKRVVDAEQAFRNGADYIVVGRPIRKATDPRKAADEIQKTIAKLFVT
jgi:orotidine-5'-phosphate decarboxylase